MHDDHINDYTESIEGDTKGYRGANDYCTLRELVKRATKRKTTKYVHANSSGKKSSKHRVKAKTTPDSDTMKSGYRNLRVWLEYSGLRRKRCEAKSDNVDFMRQGEG